MGSSWPIPFLQFRKSLAETKPTQPTSTLRECYDYVMYDARLTKGGGKRGSVEHRDFPSARLPHIRLVDARPAPVAVRVSQHLHNGSNKIRHREDTYAAIYIVVLGVMDFFHDLADDLATSRCEALKDPSYVNLALSM